MSELDSLRGIMALIVANYHFAGPFAYLDGTLAVDFFFILSGLVIAASWERRGDTETAGQFALRRLARLYPLHMFALTLVVALNIAFVVLIEYPKSHDLPGAIATQFSPDKYKDGVFFTLAQSALLLNCVGFNPSSLYWNDPSWSISVEFWANLITFKWCRDRSSTFLVIAVLGLYVVLFNGFRSLNVSFQVLYGVASGGMLRALAGIIVGLLICRLSARLPKPECRSLVARFATGCVQLACLATVILVMLKAAGTPEDYVALIASAAMIASLYRHHDTWLAAILRLPPLVFLGTISYSIYLNHYPVQYFLHDLLGFDPVPLMGRSMYFLALISFSWLTYLIVERGGQSVLRKKAAAWLGRGLDPAV